MFFFQDFIHGAREAVPLDLAVLPRSLMECLDFIRRPRGHWGDEAEQPVLGPLRVRGYPGEQRDRFRDQRNVSML